MRGFTALELIIAMAILMSFLTLGIPKMHALAERHSSQSAFYNLRRTLAQARGWPKTNSSVSLFALCRTTAAHQTGTTPSPFLMMKMPTIP